MYNLAVNTIITQTPSTDYPKRKRVLVFDGINAYNWKSGWQEMTDKGNLVLPRNILITDENGEKQPLYGSNVTVGGFNGEPLLLRGDRITLASGYTYFKKDGTQVTETSEIINGYISRVHSTVPIQLDVEDNMWLLKQTPLANKSFSDSDTLEDIMKFVIESVNKQHGTALIFKSDVQTNFGQFIVRNESAAQVLHRLRTLFGFIPYFVGNTLFCGVLIQYPTEAQTHYFQLDGEKANTVDGTNQLQFQRLDDIILSAIAHNVVTEETGSTTKDGHPKTKRTRLEVLVTLRNGQITSKVIPNGEQAPENDEGERRTFFFPQCKTTDELIKAATDQLKIYAYTGLRGTFTAYGIPYVKHGDNVVMKSDKYPEQNGIYRVKDVEYIGSTDSGLKQNIELYYKVTNTNG